MAKEIEIPEGYEARIEGNKVVIEPKESEDERIRKHIIDIIRENAGLKSIPCDVEIAWLEKKKEQKPEERFKEAREKYQVEWSEEDKKTIRDAINRIERLDHYWNRPTDEKLIERLKSLRPSWKPSDHQMNILKAVKEYVGRGSGYWGEGLGSLIEDLEKLM